MDRRELISGMFGLMAGTLANESPRLLLADDKLKQDSGVERLETVCPL
jgi:hypothetical protein